MINLPDLYDQALEEYSEDWDDQCLHASDLGYCLRQRILRISGAKHRRPTADEKRMWDMAKGVHERWYQRMQQSHVLIGSEIDVSDGMPQGWKARLDMVLNLEKELWIGDIKTSRSKAFKYQNDWPHKAHLLQVRAYQWAANHSFLPVDHGLVLYVDREGSNKSQQFEVKDSTEFLDEIDRFDQARILFHKEGILPPVLSLVEKTKGKKMEKVLSWECNYCAYNEVSCWPMKENRNG